MATVTWTTQTAMAPTYGVTRNITKVQSIVTSATASNGDVWILDNIKLPHRAVVTRVAVKGSVVDGTYILEFGTWSPTGAGATADLFGSRTLSATAVLSLTEQVTGLPATISVSDDAVQRYHTFAVRVDGAPTSGTTSVSLQFIVSYFCP